MAGSPIVMYAGAGIALLVLVGAILIFVTDRMRQAPLQGFSGLDSSRAAFRKVLLKRYLLILAITAALSGLITYVSQTGPGLAFFSGSIAILSVAAVTSAVGLDRKRYMSLVDGADNHPWARPSQQSLALGLILGSLAYLAAGLIYYRWNDPLVMLYFICGALLSAAAVRLGGSLMVLACNTAMERICDIMNSSRSKKRVPDSPARLIAADHGGLAVEFIAIYITVIMLASGLGTLETSNTYSAISNLVQVLAAAGLLFGLALLIVLRIYSDGEELPGLINRCMIGAVGLQLVVSAVAGWAILGSAALEVLWPLLAVCASLLLIAGLYQYHTSRRYKKVQNIARLSSYGPAMLNMGGNSSGMGGIIIPLILLGLCVLLAYGAGGGQNNGTACIMLAAGFLASLAPLFTAYYFTDELLDTCCGTGSDAVPADRAAAAPVRRNGSFMAGMLASLTALIIGMSAFAVINLIVYFSKESSPFAVSIFIVLAVFAGIAITLAVLALLLASVKGMMTDIYEEYRRPGREIAAGRAAWKDELYGLHVDTAEMYGIMHPWLPQIAAAAGFMLTAFFLGFESLPVLVLAFTASSYCLMLWLELTGGAWISAFRFVDAGNFAERGSEAYRTAGSFASLGLVYRQLLVPALRLLPLLALVSVLLIVISGLK